MPWSLVLKKFRLYLIAGMVFAIPLLFWPWQYDIYEWPKLCLFWAGLIGLLILQILSFGKWKIFWSKLWTLLENWKLLDSKTFFVALIIIYLLATSFSLSPWESFFGSFERHFGLITIFSFFLFFALIKDLFQEPEEFDFLLRIILISTLLVSLIAILQKFCGFWLFGAIKVHGIVRPHSTLGHPNYLGAYLAMIIPFTLYGAWNFKKYFWKFFCWLTLALELSALYLTLNRGGWLAAFGGSAIFCVVYFLVKNNFQWSWKLVGKIFLCLLIESLILISFLTGIWGAGGKERVTDLNLDHGSIYLRTQEYQFAWSQIKAQPWLGYGPESYYYLSLNRSVPDSEWQMDPSVSDRVHNWFLDHWISLGIFGLSFWIIIFYKVFSLALGVIFSVDQSKLKQKLILVALLSSLVAYLIEVQFHFDTTVTTFFVFLNFAMIYSLAKK